MSTEHLLPCPCCGSRPAFDLGYGFVAIVCSNDSCPLDPCTEYALDGCMKKITNAWNTRCVDGHVVTFHWEKPGVIGPTAVWVVIDDGYMYGPCERWQDVEKAIREDWKHERNLVG